MWVLAIKQEVSAATNLLTLLLQLIARLVETNHRVRGCLVVVLQEPGGVFIEGDEKLDSIAKSLFPVTNIMEMLE